MRSRYCALAALAVAGSAGTVAASTIHTVSVMTESLRLIDSESGAVSPIGAMRAASVGPGTPVDGIGLGQPLQLWRDALNKAAQPVDTESDWPSSGRSRGGVTVYDEDQAGYLAAVGDHPVIGFNEPVGFTYPLDNEYSDVGILFTDDQDAIIESLAFGDSFGVNGQGDIEIQFAEAQSHLGVAYPGAIEVSLFFQGSPVWTSGQFGSTGADHFVGLVSGFPFDSVVLRDPVDGLVFIDDLHYNVVPEPATIFMLVLGGSMFVGLRRPKR